MKKLFDKNMSALGLSVNDLDFGKPIFDGSIIEVLDSKTGDPVPSILFKNGKKIAFHSRIDPIREAKRFIGESSYLNMDLIVVLGFAFGYHCEALLDVCGAHISIVIIERDHLLFSRALENRDLSDLFLDDRVSVLVNPEVDNLSLAFRGMSSRRVSFVSHRGSFQIYGDYYANIFGIIKSHLSTKDVNISTLSKFEKTWGSNIARNIKIISSARGIELFFDKFKDVPAIVVAAGPSLTDSFEFIKKNIGKALIVAVDTSYKLLIDNGIVPHFCLAVDPQLINSRYFEGTGETDTVLVADPTVHPSVFRFFRGRIVLTGMSFDLMKWVESIGGHRGELAHGGSVSTNAYDFSRRLGASPIVMVGQDLSFTSGLAHVRGSYLDEQIHNNTFRFDNCQMFNRRQLRSLPPVFVDGIRGKLVQTNQKMMIFQQWFERRNDENLINATTDGVIIKGIKTISHDTLYFADSGFSISARIDRILNSSVVVVESKGVLEKFKIYIGEMIDEIEALIPVLKKSSEFADQLSKMIISGRDKGDPGKTNYILKKLSEADEFIESRKKSKNMISFSIQRVIHTITEGYDIEEKEINAGERSKFLYMGLLEGAKFNLKILSKMNRFLLE